MRGLIVHTFVRNFCLPMKHILPFVFFLLVSVAVQAQNSIKAELTVYPNPASEHISVQDPNDAVGYVAVINLVGKKVKEFDFVKDEPMPIGDLPKGMYLVQIQDRNRQILKTQKVDKR